MQALGHCVVSQSCEVFLVIAHCLGDLGEVPGGNARAPGKEKVAVFCVQPVCSDLSASQRVIVVGGGTGWVGTYCC